MRLIDDFLVIHEYADELAALFVDFGPIRRLGDLLEAPILGGYGLVFAAYTFNYQNVLRPSRPLR